MMEIFALRLIEEIELNLLNKLMPFLAQNRQLKISRFIREKDALRALFADIFIRYLIIHKLAIKNEDISFATNPYGKPYLENDNKFHFNLSHSGDWIVCALDDQPIGIDVELIKPIDFKISQRFFATAEDRMLLDRSEEERLPFFYTLWTLKESYIKAVGQGLSIPLHSFQVDFSNQKYIAISTNDGIVPDKFLKQYDLNNRYKMAVCANHRRFPESIAFLTIEQITEFFLRAQGKI